MNDDLKQQMVQVGLPTQVSRRQAMQWVMGAMAASALPASRGAFAEPAALRKDFAQPRPGVVGAGYGVDANLVAVHHPGDLWPLTFDDHQKKTAALLADLILPADNYGPAASTVGVVPMIDEWISAPYPQQQSDRPVILDGLKWLDDEAKRRFSGPPFFQLSTRDLRGICDDICHPASAKPEFKTAAHFFSRFRSLAAGAYYATPEGWKAIGYVGNVPLASFDGPPPEVLQKLGVTQTVK
ncbi:MAG TPA: gluconate 2-dehydrogenase subunit 3 family protein [Tepidisphaeraceae bacterium]|jgi:hypothetical protein|nr:gluconate 2-dehydrogenase subunit 3 family protein [Tepidisphaeraceae bacterium]